MLQVVNPGHELLWTDTDGLCALIVSIIGIYHRKLEMIQIQRKERSPQFEPFLRIYINRNRQKELL